MKRSTMLLLMLLTPVIGNGKEDPAATAALALEPFRNGLQRALQAGMAQGPEHAIDVCRLDAPEIAARAQQPGIRIGRTSHRVRNPDNAPAAWMQPVLDAYLAESNRGPELVRIDAHRIGYVEPILTQPLCLACHGRNISDGVRERIDEHYPADRATGFEVGDFRGMFWVELDVPAD